MLKRKKLIIWIIVVLAIIAGGYFYLQSKKPKTEYVTADVARGNLAQTVSVTGTVNPDSQIDLAFKTGGKIAEVFAQTGERVKKGQKIAKLDSIALMSQLRQAEADISIQKHNYSNMKKIDTYTAEVKKAQKDTIKKAEITRGAIINQLVDTNIYAPIDGIVLHSDYENGEIIAAGQTVAVISLEGDLIIESKIPESDIVKIGVGQKASVNLDAFGQDDKFEAEIFEIDPASTVVQDVVYYKIKLKISNPSSKFKPGMSADIDVRTAEVSDILMIPMRAIETDTQKHKFVQILGLQNKIDKVEITTGLEGDEGMVEIKSGLKEGQKVITYVKKGA